MSKTEEFYKLNAEHFYNETINVHMSPLYSKLERNLAPHSLIVDAGAGSGRDTIYFKSKGHSVYAFDGSAELCELAKSKSNVEIKCHDFLEIPSDIKPDAIWACASLLHLTKKQIATVFQKYFELLNDGGLFYSSFKYGTFEGERSGRYFTDLDEKSINELLKMVPFTLVELWKTPDARPGRESELWLNVILKK